MLKALGNPTRFQIVKTLAECQRCITKDIVDQMPLAQSTVSQHLNLLRTNGVVEGDRRGNKIFYRVVSPQAICMIECLREHGDKL